MLMWRGMVLCIAAQWEVRLFCIWLVEVETYLAITLAPTRGKLEL